MTKAELTALARRKKIKVSSGLLKDGLIKTIKKGLRKLESAKKTKAAAKKSSTTKTAARTKKSVSQKTKKAKSVTKKKAVQKTSGKKSKAAAKKASVKKKTSKKVSTKKGAVKRKVAKKVPLKKAARGKTAVKTKTRKAVKTADRKTKTILTSRKPAADKPEKSDLPTGYGDNRLVAMARDPYWAYAYWDMTPGRIREFSRLARHEAGHPRWILRTYSAPLQPITDKGSFFDIEIDVHSGSYYLNLSRPGARFILEIGVVDAAGLFHAAAESNPVIMPMDHPSEGTAKSGYFSADSSYPASASSWPKPPSSGNS